MQDAGQFPVSAQLYKYTLAQRQADKVERFLDARRDVHGGRSRVIYRPRLKLIGHSIWNARLSSSFHHDASA